MKPEKASYHGIDDLRFVATIGVILLHASAGMISLYGKVPDNYWSTGLIYNAVTRFSVPAFVMISGSLLLTKEYKTTDFFKKRFARILFPFVFYATIYLAYHLIINLLYGHHHSWKAISLWLYQKISSGISYHFWFVYMILGLYLIIPFLGKWLRKQSEKTVLLLLFSWLIYNTIQIIDGKFCFPISQTLNYTGYLILGYYLCVKRFRNPRQMRVAGLSLFLVAYLINIWAMTTHAPSLGVLYDNFSPTTTLMAIGIFLFFKHSFLTDHLWVTVRMFVCRHSFGIYLIHILVLKWLSIAHIHWNFTHPSIAIPITTVLTLIVSSLLAYGISKLPFGKYISG